MLELRLVYFSARIFANHEFNLLTKVYTNTSSPPTPVGIVVVAFVVVAVAIVDSVSFCVVDNFLFMYWILHSVPLAAS